MLKVDFQKPVARVMLDRPDVHNAFNDELIPQVTHTFIELGARDDVRVIVLGGNGKSFCAGADLKWMKRMVHYTREQNLEDARAVGRMYLTIAKCPKPVIARLGPGRAREFFITGERFLAPVALTIGLVQHVAAHELALDGLIDSKISQILTSAPNAIAAAKELIFGVAARTLESSLEFAADAIARARTGEEGQAGMQAFLERQKPPWIEKNEKNEKNERIDTK